MFFKNMPSKITLFQKGRDPPAPASASQWGYPIIGVLLLLLAHLGPRWPILALSGVYVGPLLGLCWAILNLCWPMLGLCNHLGGLCWVILGYILRHLC